MRRLFLSMFLLLGAACTPGSGEYGSCVTTADCQVNLFCEPIGGVTNNDGGFPIADGGVCRKACQLSTDCLNNEQCGTNGFCSSDGGY